MPEKTLDTHINLISGQPLPNLLPAIDPGLRPRRIIQIVSPDMRERAEWLRDLLAQRRIRVEQWPVDDPWDIEHLQTRLLELLEQEAEEIGRQQIGLNVTGGTKPMSIAAYEACRAYDLPIFYIHPEKDRLIWLHPSGAPARDLADRIRIEDFLSAHGIHVRGEPGRNVPNPSLLRVSDELIEQIDRYGHALSQLNWLANHVDRNLLSKPVHNVQRLRELIGQFERHGFLRRQRGRLRFPNEAARFFVNGGWLEYRVFDAVRQLRGDPQTHIHDIVRSIEIERQAAGAPVPNELDVVFLSDNRLHLIECKTRKFRGEGEGSPGAEAIYKLDTLADITGGLQARAMLVSYQDLSVHDLDRARDLGIAVCAGAQLRHLEGHLREFIGH